MGSFKYFPVLLSVKKSYLFAAAISLHSMCCDFQVHRKLAASDSKGDMYETELLEQSGDTDAAAEFFACLDHQLNKVNQFFRTKEKEFLDRGDSLRNQMEILIELKTMLEQKRGKGPLSQESKEDDSVSGTISCGKIITQFLPTFLIY